jgi:ribonucleoside-diphosphate reductase alpha chain
LSGEFTVINSFLVSRLKVLGLWDKRMVDDLKYFDGELGEISRIPDDVKRLFKTAFDVTPDWLIRCASKRQKWIDMGQSLNLYMAQPSGKKLDTMYKLAWQTGLKTTYYLRALGATQAEKSTVSQTRGVNAVESGQAGNVKSDSDSSSSRVSAEKAINAIRKESIVKENADATMPLGSAAMACSILNGEECEACQ